MITASSEIRVRYAETDAMGIAYHGNYLAWFEVARVALLDKLGLPYKALDDAGFLLPVLEVGIRYIASARFDDKLTITASMSEQPRVRIHIDYTIHLGDQLITTGHTLHAFMNRTGQAIKPPLFVQQRFAAAFAK
ncbi:MAG: acyl-CoA thioesterase [Puniceicoccales bacterium]|jgi:acyl-CoA thioester hydrolase|nr:acyl-CoA thioesterase [Puniceicoccales bacterium]